MWIHREHILDQTIDFLKTKIPVNQNCEFLLLLYVSILNPEMFEELFVDDH